MCSRQRTRDTLPVSIRIYIYTYTVYLPSYRLQPPTPRENVAERMVRGSSWRRCKRIKGMSTTMEENGLAIFFANLGTQNTTRSLYT